MFIGCYNKSVILTYIGVLVSLYGLLATDEINIQMICLILAGICDLFDGVIARKCKRTDTEKKFGVQIDSLVDIISFCIFPVVMFTNIVGLSWISLVISGLFVLSGVTRLAWFNILTEDENTDKRYFTGLPVTYSALIIPVVNMILGLFRVSVYTYKLINLITYIFILIFYILNVKIKKPTGKLYILFSLLAIIVMGWFVYACI